MLQIKNRSVIQTWAIFQYILFNLELKYETEESKALKLYVAIVSDTEAACK